MLLELEKYKEYIEKKEEALKNNISFKEPEENGFTAKCKGFTVKDGNILTTDYNDVVSGKTPQVCKETTQIRSGFSKVTKNTINKVSLSSLNNKGIVLNNQSGTVLPFYKKLEK
jgi:hypothetical protein